MYSGLCVYSLVTRAIFDDNAPVFIYITCAKCYASRQALNHSISVVTTIKCRMNSGSFFFLQQSVSMRQYTAFPEEIPMNQIEVKSIDNTAYT